MFRFTPALGLALGTLLVPTTPSYSAQLDPSNIIEPSTLCLALSSLGIDGGTWKPAKNIPGGWYCDGYGNIYEVDQRGQLAPQSQLGLHNTMQYYVAGSQDNKLDYIMIKLNAFMPDEISAPKNTFLKAVGLASRATGVEAPKEVMALVKKESPTRRSELPPGTGHETKFERKVGLYIVRYRVEHSLIDTMVFELRNPFSSDIWD